ncbi:hypothetical protein PRIPAC_74333 [Pristionchus pacificus]|uniref:Uncharacterized protein n=1 Tax=Pristionchus pacificus TaxID=54126 RepID=A0A2A6B4U0_PRIPA|nr:hypothetical protein PRIPAC_74333 [Pristionchus pacificus]|eukprot:PDM60905.1 hypothetical protein PRIPAC_54711 [Pristionchus pacificus]
MASDDEFDLEIDQELIERRLAKTHRFLVCPVAFAFITDNPGQNGVRPDTDNNGQILFHSSLLLSVCPTSE